MTTNIEIPKDNVTLLIHGSEQHRQTTVIDEVGIEDVEAYVPDGGGELFGAFEAFEASDPHEDKEQYREWTAEEQEATRASGRAAGHQGVLRATRGRGGLLLPSNLRAADAIC